jgi:MATE family multidrug resistance protein
METIIEKLNSYKHYLREILKLSWPMLIGNMGNMLIGVEDVFVAARHSTNTLAAISVATAIFMSIFIAGIGFLASISPIISNRRGGRKPSKNLFAISIAYSGIMSIIFFFITRVILLYIGKIGLAPVLTPMVEDYINICSFSIFGAYLYNALREFLQAYEIVMLPNLISILAIIINPILCFILVFGLFGFPELGVKGLAITALIIRSLMGLSLLIFCLSFFKGKMPSPISYLKELLKVGWPIAISLFVEFSGFNATAVLVGKISPVLAAAHNIIITFAGTSFMVPLAISNAMAVKVGFANGQGNFNDIKKYSIVGIGMILLFMSFTAFLFISIPKLLINIFTNDAAILQVALPVMAIVACFQIFDGMQVGFSGVLKGLKLTKYIMFTTAMAYWIVGIPLGCILAFKYHIVLIGFWSGLALALLTASLISGMIIIRKFKQIKIQRSHI